MEQNRQFTVDQRNFLALEYHKRKGTRDFKQTIINEFTNKFPGAKIPSKNTMKNIWEKQMKNGTVTNCCSKVSPGQTYSGRPKSARSVENIDRVRAVMDRDALKVIGDPNNSPVNSARRNSLGIDKSAWSRIAKGLSYHPYKPVRRQELKAEDYMRRAHFCEWVGTRSNQQISQILFSDEANFCLSGLVNSQNVRRYALLSSDNENSGRPAHFVVEKPTFSPKLMVFCGLRKDGVFGLKFYQNKTMTGPEYHKLLQYDVFPELRDLNGGSLDGLWWQQDGAPCHVTDQNMTYLDSNFQSRVISRRSIRGIDWPAR